MRKVVIAARVAVALGIVAAVVVQLRSSIDFAGRDGDPDTVTVLVNFFSYFTIESNTLAAGLLLVGAFRLATHREESRGYALLEQGAVIPWSNEVLHVVGPAYLLLDWCLAPDRSRIPTRDVLVVIAFPLLWAAYTLVRGPFASDPYLKTGYWYPYPFLNPVTLDGGYAAVAAYVVGIAAVFVVIAAGVLWISRRPDPAPA